MLSRHRFCCYICLLNALLLRGCGFGLHSLPTLLFITLAYIDYFYRLIVHSIVHSNLDNGIIFLFFFFFVICYSANSTLLSVLRFSYFITPYDAEASSAFSALIYTLYFKLFVCMSRIALLYNRSGARKCMLWIRFLKLSVPRFTITPQEIRYTS